MKKSDITIASLEKAFKRKGYEWFTDDTREFNLNIFGIRTADKAVDVFNDFIGMAWKYKGVWNLRVYPATTDPGIYWLQRLLNPRGCAILVPGQYKGVYGLRLHRGAYEALCQTWGPVRVYRDGDRDSTLDFEPNTITKGDYGINIHASVSSGVATKVGKFSAGCQVFQSFDDFVEARDYWRKSKDRFGNHFSYTLLEEKDFE